MSLKEFLRGLISLSLIFVATQVLFRIVFYSLFVSDVGLFEIDFWKSFLLGLRFDLTVLAYIQALPLLLLIPIFMLWRSVPGFFVRFARGYYLLFFFLVVLLNLSDLGFYSYFQDRLNLMIFGFFEDDTKALVKTMWSDHPMVIYFLTLGISSGLFWVFLRRRFVIETRTWFVPKSARGAGMILLVILFLFNGMLARGSFALFPLSEMDLEVTSSPALNQMAYNSSRAFARTLELRAAMQAKPDLNIQRFGYGSDISKAYADYFSVAEVPENPVDLMRATTLQRGSDWLAPHVVLFVMESWGQHWMQYQSGAFDLVGSMKTHLQADLFLSHCLPGTGGTIGSLSSLLAGQMHRYGFHFLSETEFLQIPFETSPARIYEAAGYESRLVYGGNAGWRELGKFARAQGYSKVDGDVEIRARLGGKILEEHPWGIYDEDVFTYVEEVLKTATKPQFVVVMTTTNHPPFNLPKDYQRPSLTMPEEVRSVLTSPVDIAQKRFDTYRYSLEMFADFMGKVKNSELSDKTLVAATGDHNFWMIQFKAGEPMARNGVPFYLYAPAKYLEGHPAKEETQQVYMSHQDILPTLYQMSLSGVSYLSMGKSIFQQTPSESASFDGFGLAVSADGFISGADSLNLQVETPEAITRLEKVRTRYRALQAILDDYFRYEKERFKNK